MESTLAIVVKRLVFVVFIIPLLFTFALVVYRVYLHPLAKYPGPFIAKITDLYSFYQQWRGDRHLDFHRQHQKYGPIFRYGPNSLSFNTSTANQTIHAPKANCQKSRFYEGFPPVKGAWSIVSAIPRDIHARKRRVLSHAFSDKAIRNMEAFILPQVRTFCELLAETGKKGVVNNMSQLSNYMSFDIMGDLCFGKTFSMQTREENRFVTELISGRVRNDSVVGHISAIKNSGVDKYLLGKNHLLQKRFMQYASGQTLERLDAGISEDRKDFFYYLLNAKDPETGSGLSTAELRSEAAALIVAGSDTSSTALAASFFYLGRPENISALNKLVTELKDTFNDVEEIKSGTKLNSCQYLRACIDEALRLSPPVPGALPREVLAGGMAIDGEFIPARVDVTVPIYALHHNASYFPDPEKFKPNRWIKTFSPPEELQVAQEAFSVFSLGPRGCIGKNMAYMELLITVARVVWLFEFRLIDGGKGRISSGDKEREGIFEISDYFVAEKDGPMMEVVERA